MKRAVARKGLSILEVTIVATVIGILVTLTVPRFGRAVEQARVDIAAANLRAIWTAQRLYWLDNRMYTTDLSGMAGLGLVDPAVPTVASPYVYRVTTSSSTGFTATATRSGSTSWVGTLTIDQTGAVTGSVAGPSSAVLTPGFQ